jgi:hypothetical protein
MADKANMSYRIYWLIRGIVNLFSFTMFLELFLILFRNLPNSVFFGLDIAWDHAFSALITLISILFSLKLHYSKYTVTNNDLVVESLFERKKIYKMYTGFEAAGVFSINFYYNLHFKNNIMVVVPKLDKEIDFLEYLSQLHEKNVLENIASLQHQTEHDQEYRDGEE